MKTIVITACCLFTLKLNHSIHAQSAATPHQINKLVNDLPANIHDTSITYPDVRNYINWVNVKVMRAFVKAYKNPEDVQWHKRDWGYLTEFTMDSIQNIVAYKNSGFCLYEIKKYNEKYMPQWLRHKVKTTYYDYKILLIDEINTYEQENTIYVVLIQDNNHTKQVRICDGEMQEIADLIKK